MINSDGTGEVQLTSDDLYAHTPSFGVDGKSVTYFTDDGQFSIPAERDAIATRIGSAANYADFSKDGKQMLFSDGKYSPDYEIYVSDVDGSNRRQVTKSKHGCFHGRFSRAGDKIYFLMEEWPQGPTGHPKSRICTINSDGTDLQQVTDLSLFDHPIKRNNHDSP